MFREAVRAREEVMHTKLKYAFETIAMDDTLIAVPVGDGAKEFHGVIKLNETAALILNLLKEDVSEDQISDAISEEYDAPMNVIKENVRQCLETFKERGILV